MFPLTALVLYLAPITNILCGNIVLRHLEARDNNGSRFLIYNDGIGGLYYRW